VTAVAAENGLDVASLCHLFESENISFSQSLLEKVKNASSHFRCNHCRAHYDTEAELVKHLVGNRSHIVKPQQLRERKLALLARVHRIDQSDVDESRHALDYDTLSPAEKRTLVELAIDRAYMEHVRNSLR
jgi:hypothetical protein